MCIFVCTAGKSAVWGIEKNCKIMQKIYLFDNANNTHNKNNFYKKIVYSIFNPLKEKVKKGKKNLYLSLSLSLLLEYY